MLERLSPGPMSVSKLAEPLQVTLAAVVQHLQILQKAGLVETERSWIEHADQHVHLVRCAADSLVRDG